MTSMPSSSSPLSPLSASNSEHSATKPEVDDSVPINDGILNKEEEKKPDTNLDHFEFLNGADYLEKYKKYETDYTRRLMAKYFTKKSIYGRNIFEAKTTVDDQIIMSSRWPGTRSYADPVVAFEDLSSGSSTSTEETGTTTLSNRKHAPSTNA